MNNRPLRILMISEQSSPFALLGCSVPVYQKNYVDSIARKLGKLGHHVDILTRHEDPCESAVVQLERGVQLLQVNGGTCAHVPQESLLAFMPNFAANARQFLHTQGPYDVIHANFFMSGWLGMRLRPWLNAPLVTTFHDLDAMKYEGEEVPSLRMDIERRLISTSDRLIVESPQDRRDLLRLYAAESGKIRLVPRGVDTCQFRPGRKQIARQRLGLSQGEFIVLQLGFLKLVDIDIVIEAMNRFPADVPARLVVLCREVDNDHSAASEIVHLQALAAEMGVGQRVNFAELPDCNALRDWYVAADVFVTMPGHDSLSTTPLEAMACGTPVVTSNQGVARYTVQDGITGFHVPPSNPVAIANRLLELLRHPELGEAFGCAGVARVQATFTWDRVTSKLVSVFSQLRDLPLERARNRVSKHFEMLQQNVS